jgi:hypothetical protein
MSQIDAILKYFAVDELGFRLVDLRDAQPTRRLKHRGAGTFASRLICQ